MKDEEIIKFIRALESAVPTEGAEARFINFGKVALYANKEGYLRMGLELMKCAFKDTYPEADLEYLFDKETDFSIDHLVADEEQLEFITS